MISPRSPEPEEIASEGALAAAQAFFAALAARRADAVWAAFSDRARDYIINVGHERGMDFDLAARLRAGSASEQEMESFLADLLAGLERDLRGVDLSRLAFEAKAEPEAPMQVRVNYLVTIGPQIEGVQTAIPAGSLVLALEEDGWKLERIEPRPPQG